MGLKKLLLTGGIAAHSTASATNRSPARPTKYQSNGRCSRFPKPILKFASCSFFSSSVAEG